MKPPSNALQVVDRDEGRYRLMVAMDGGLQALEQAASPLMANRGALGYVAAQLALIGEQSRQHLKAPGTHLVQRLASCLALPDGALASTWTQLGERTKLSPSDQVWVGYQLAFCLFRTAALDHIQSGGDAPGSDWVFAALGKARCAAARLVTAVLEADFRKDWPQGEFLLLGMDPLYPRVVISEHRSTGLAPPERPESWRLVGPVTISRAYQDLIPGIGTKPSG